MTDKNSPEGESPQARYNKHYNNSNRQKNTKPGYRKNHSSNNKVNHHQSNSQYSNYNAAAAAAAANAAAYNNGMYGYYQGYPYMVPPMGMYPPTQQGNIPNLSPAATYSSVTPNGSTPGSTPVSAGSSSAASGTPSIPPVQGALSPQPQVSKVSIKITDKDGNKIGFEDRKKHFHASSSTTPLTSPKKQFASPVKQTPVPLAQPIAPPHAVVPPVASPIHASSAAPTIPAVAAPTAPNPLVNDFKERIRLKAEAAKAAKAAKAAAEQKEKEEKEAVAQGVSQKEEPKEEVKAQPKEESVPEKAPEAVPVVAQEEAAAVESPKEEPKEEVAEQVAEPVVKEPTPSVEAEKPVETKVPVKEEEVEAEEPTPSEEEEKSVVTEDSEKEGAEKDVANDAAELEGDEEIAEENEDEDEEESVPGIALSHFFERLKEAKPIEDPYNTKYPEPFVGLDSRWKSEVKKYRYDPQFLIQFRDVVQFDIDDEWKNNLANLGIVAQSFQKKFPGSGRGARGLPSRFGLVSGRSGGFDRNNSRNGSKRKGGSTRDKSKRSNQSRRKEKEEKKPAEDVKPLEKSANRWVPRSRVQKEEVKMAPDGVTPILEEEEVERKVNSLLNKLTLEMFDAITDQILAIMEQSKWEDDGKTVKQVIGLTFAKACDEPYWSSMYAQFCAKMCTKLSDEIAIKEGDRVLAQGGDSARRLLLTTCQREYEKGWSDKVPTSENGAPLEMMTDEYYIAAAAKRRGLGLVKFIGQLYLLSMLNDRVITKCLSDLTRNIVDPSEDSLESLAQLITAVGPKFEQSENNKTTMAIVFDSIQKILDTVKLSSRIKFMLLDLQELRANRWISDKADQGPKTIKEIHDDAELKRLEEEKAQLERRRKNKGGDSRSNSTRSGSNWGSAPKRVESNSKFTPLKDSKGFTAVSRSQSTRTEAPATRDNSRRSETPIQSATNMFAALGFGDEEHNEKDSEVVETGESGQAVESTDADASQD